MPTASRRSRIAWWSSSPFALVARRAGWTSGRTLRWSGGCGTARRPGSSSSRRWTRPSPPREAQRDERPRPLPQAPRGFARRLQRSRPRRLDRRLDGGLRVAPLPHRTGGGRSRLPRPEWNSSLVRGRRRDVLRDARRTEDVPRGGRPRPRPGTDDREEASDRRGGEQRGGVAHRAPGREAPARLGPPQPRRGPARGGRGGALAVQDRREAALDLRAGEGPLAQDLPPVASIDAGHVDDGRRRADQLTGVDGEVRASAHLLADLLESRRRRLPAAVRARLEDGGHRPGERPLDQAHPESFRILAAGERIAVLGVREHQG